MTSAVASFVDSFTLLNNFESCSRFYIYLGIVLFYILIIQRDYVRVSIELIENLSLLNERDFTKISYCNCLNYWTVTLSLLITLGYPGTDTSFIVFFSNYFMTINKSINVVTLLWRTFVLEKCYLSNAPRILKIHVYRKFVYQEFMYILLKLSLYISRYIWETIYS